MSEVNVSDNLQILRERIARAEQSAGRSPSSVNLVAVSKTKPISLIRAVASEGQQAFGENYAQEAIEKADALAELALQWHFIGPVQSNKTQGLAKAMSWVHTVDRLKIARRLSDQRPENLPALNICLQVNISREPSKAGLPPDQVAALAHEVVQLPRLRLRGLMAIPAPTENISQQRRAFADMRELLQTLQRALPELDTLSMGMSGDLEAAIAEGATLIRVGSDIFGSRT